MITIDGLTFQYKNSTQNALQDIHLTIEDGDFLGIIGESGAGKTTLIRALNGIIPHHFPGDYYGSVKIDGQDTFDVTPSALSLKVVTVFQDIDSQMISSVVEDEILFGLENFSIPREEIESRLSGALEAGDTAAEIPEHCALKRRTEAKGCHCGDHRTKAENTAVG